LLRFISYHYLSTKEKKRLSKHNKQSNMSKFFVVIFWIFAVVLFISITDTKGSTAPVGFYLSLIGGAIISLFLAYITKSKQ